MFSLSEVVQSIDHTLLKPDSTERDFLRLCREAKELGVKAVCVLPYYIPFCVRQLKDTQVVVAAVIGFPLGAASPGIKAIEAQKAFSDGATEIDMVINIGALKDRKISDVYEDIEQVVKVARTFSDEEKLIKVIIESCLLTDEEKKLACDLSVKAGANYVKTSTGYNGGGATVEDVKLMVSAVGNKAKVKASGGIRSWKQAEELLLAGASRIGTSCGKNIVTQYRENYEDNSKSR